MEKIYYTDRRITKSKTAIKNALVSLMQSNMIDDITVTNIVKKANINRSTFYKHYQLKEEVLKEIYDEVICDITKAFQRPYQNMDFLKVENLTVSEIKIFDHVEKYSNLYAAIFKTNHFLDFQRILCNNLIELQLQEFKLLPSSNINKDLLARYRAYAILGLIKEWVDEEFKYSSSYMTQQLIEIMNTRQSSETYRINKS